MKTSPRALTVKNNWRNKLLAWEADYSQAKGRRANISPVDLGTGLMRSGEGMPIGKIKQDDKQVTVLLKEKGNERKTN